MIDLASIDLDWTELRHWSLAWIKYLWLKVIYRNHGMNSKSNRKLDVECRWADLLEHVI
jgi:hypothetical protein